MPASRRSTTPSPGARRWPRPTPFATKDPNVGVAKVPDERLDRLAEMSNSKNVVPASVQFVDIGGLVEGASTGEGLGNKFLANIREADAIVFVLRAFEDDDVPGPSDPLEHLRIVETELALADLETVESQIEKRRKAAKQERVDRRRGRGARAGARVPRRGHADLPQRPRGERPRAARALLPAHQQAGAGRRQRGRGRPRPHRREDRPGASAELGGHGEVIGMCVQLEAEAAQLDADERAEMLEGLGLGEGALPRFLNTAYRMLGLRTFFTTGREGVPGLDLPGRLQGAAVRRA